MKQDQTENSVSLKGMVEEILKNHHEPTREWIAQGKALLQRAAEQNLVDPLVNKLGMSFQSLAMTMSMHMEKEEEVLFPMFQRMEEGFNTEKLCGGIENPIRVMESEHQDLDLHMERLHRITNDFEVTAETPLVVRHIYEILKLLEADLKVHSEKEENLLFPAAVVCEKKALERRVDSENATGDVGEVAP